MKYKAEILYGNEKAFESKGKTIEEAIDNLKEPMVKASVQLVISKGKKEGRRLLRPIQYRKMKANDITKKVIAKQFKTNFNE